ncbi:uncharacterized protein LOC129926261 [Biomphalaria glabrata]|uniref:Uncharacterized protein LOC129926261 n=1 Tax=Biomphalaria glabrata TaxID=6526 RepID=A0A9W3AD17_BIOGL|nr:uncharacterized protein LOC129926261 [Biomphalaria glabrata]
MMDCVIMAALDIVIHQIVLKHVKKEHGVSTVLRLAENNVLIYHVTEILDCVIVDVLDLVILRTVLKHVKMVGLEMNVNINATVKNRVALKVNVLINVMMVGLVTSVNIVQFHTRLLPSPI